VDQKVQFAGRGAEWRGGGQRHRLIAERWEVSRAEQDELGLRSHQLAVRATDEGRFEREIIPMQVDGKTLSFDQGIRRDTSLEALAALKPAFKYAGSVTAETPRRSQTAQQPCC
jgi:acetyl-CoA acyltransferase